MQSNSANNKWINPSLYPFQSHYLKLDDGKMHYIDEGSGDTLLFVHGTPTWSFLYRDFVKELSSKYRCIAVDHLGFGLSDKSMSFSGTPEAHASNLKYFIEKLNLKNITLIVHDFGGPIGLGAALEMDSRIARVVLFNSWLWSTAKNKDAMKIDRIVNSTIGKWLYLNLNLSAKFLLKQGFANKKLLTSTIHRHYTNPFPDKASRYAPLKIAQALVGSSDWYQQQWDQLNKLSQKKWLILWGIKDAFINQNYLDRWSEKLPHAKVVKMDCGHFVQEENSANVISAIRTFLEP